MQVENEEDVLHQLDILLANEEERQEGNGTSVNTASPQCMEFMKPHTCHLFLAYHFQQHNRPSNFNTLVKATVKLAVKF